MVFGLASFGVMPCKKPGPRLEFNSLNLSPLRLGDSWN